MGFIQFPNCKRELQNQDEKILKACAVGLHARLKEKRNKLVETNWQLHCYCKTLIKHKESRPREKISQYVGLQKCHSDLTEKNE